MRKHFVLLLALLLCITLLSGCSAKETTAPHSFGDLTLRLPVEFLDLSDASYAAEYDFLFGMDPVIISGLRDEKALLASFDLDIQRYGQLVIEINGLSCDLTQKDGIWNFTYEAEGYTYVVTLQETKDAFWTVQAYCPTESYPQVNSQMWEILKSVTV